MSKILVPRLRQLFLLGLVLALMSCTPQDSQISVGSIESAAMSALVEIPEARIVHFHCEETLSPRVGAWMAAYVVWSLGKNRDSPDMKCSSTQPAECRISFGGGSGGERWGRHLEFSFDTVHNRISTETLKCLDVP
jgi:hypothetical protein